MSRFSKAIGSILTGGAKSFVRFPAAMASALVVAVTGTVMVAVDPSDTRVYANLIMAFLCAGFWGIALSSLSDMVSGKKVPFAILNGLSILGGLGLFSYLQFLVPDDPSSIIIARIFAAAVAAFILFLITISADQMSSDFNQASFMVLKSALIALLYGLVIMLGLFFVAFAVENLLYENLSENVYAYISIWSAFISFAFFLGYFPSFNRQQRDSHLDTAQKHPAFIEVLFAFVMVPIMAAMTLVLLIWAIQILIVGNWPEFEQLTAIFTVYTLFGVFLAVMMAHYDKTPANLFKRLFPFAALVFLAFEAYALYIRISEYGIRSNEYFIGLLWIFGLLSVLALLIRPVSRNRIIAFVAIVLTILTVLPITNYQAVPLASQTKRLQTVLNKNDMIVDGSIVMAPASISLSDRETITNAAMYIMRSNFDEATKAPWLRDQLDSNASFISVFGFEPQYEAYPDGPGDKVYNEVYLNLPVGSIDITGYSQSLLIGGNYYDPVRLAGQLGEYEIEFVNMSGPGIPSIWISRDNMVIAQQSLESWLDDLSVKYMTENGRMAEPAFEDMTYLVEASGVKLLVVFQNISIYYSTGEDMNIYLNPAAAYFAEIE